ncbi:galactokinase [Candidatus Atribacteria bacterium CG2_30_33_13]|uniref:Galactokinase n=3 Tax=Candidatus Infernicultor aquiphilus TaxID=1805029 RepID=A0A1J5GDZ6_9BACT|nr:MAG: galactokinase [Candidatus Atribacteria bacterium CG2_30_33_13]
MQDLNKLGKIFNEKFTDTSLVKGAFSAPGRVNLIGEHTDYNEGFVLPMAIEREIIMLGQLRNDRLVQVFDLAYKAETKFSLDNLFPSKKDTWANYLMGVVDEIQKTGYILQGANIIFISNIPQKAGLSSSAALEIVTALTMAELNLLKIEPVKMARLCQQAENNFVGVACGIMDQYVSRLGRKDNVLFIDCRTNNYELIPFRDSNYQIVICDSKIRRDLINSEYNKRREECKKATEFFTHRFGHKVQALRDVTIEEFKQYQEQLPETIARRARHVILENDRVQASKKAIEAGDYITFGQLMIESHQSLKVDYEVSCEELDLLVDLALKQEGVLGARMTGAGFGGCTVNLLKREKVNIFKKTIQKEYKRITGIIPDIYITIPADGAKVLKF